MSEAKYILALDIGGTKLAVGLMALNGQMVAHSRQPTLVWEGPGPVIDRLFRQADELLGDAKIPPEALIAAGIGTGGPLDPWRGVIHYAPNMPGWINIPLRQIVEERYQVPTFLDNDANAAALGEHWFGAGQDDPNLIYMTVSTGIGGGILVDGHIFHGTNGNAAEFGHVVVEPEGPLCACGGRGCLEAVASGTNIARRMREALLASQESTVLQMAEGKVDQVTTEMIVQAAREGDELASAIFGAAARQIGLGLVSIIHVLNPNLVIIGGGVSTAGELLLAPIREAFRRHGMRGLIDQVRVVTAALGKDVGVISAGTLALEGIYGSRERWRTVMAREGA